MANTYLTRTASGTDGTNSQRKNTISMWLKRSSLSDACFIEGQGNDANATQVYFDSNTKLTVNHVSGNSSLNFQIVTNRVFRDTSAWYHFVITIDTTLGTAADRVKIYVNGVRETSFSSASYPGQNATTQLLARLNLNIIGRRKSGGVGLYFDGSMSHVHVTDGTVYQASTFGSTDSTTGEWKINTSPSVTYGNNGFFILKDGNSVTDQSGKNNNFSVGGGTLTNTKDCPDNVMATLNPLSGSSSNNTLSNGNNTIAVTSGWRWRPSTIAPSSGKYYAEFKPTSSGNIYTAIGVTPQVSWKDIDGETIGSGAGGENKSVAYTHSGTVIKGNSTQYSGSSYAPNDIIGVALDLDNHKVYFSKNGTYQNSGNPASGATGTGAVSLDATLDDWSISISCAGTTTTANYGNGYFGTTAITTNSGNGYAGAEGASKFNYQPPSGYSALNTKGLNQ